MAARVLSGDEGVSGSATRQLQEASRLVKLGEPAEITAVNLRYWPYVVDPELDSAVCKVDLGLRCEHQEHAVNVLKMPGAGAPGQRCGACGHTVGTKSVKYEWVCYARNSDWLPKGHYKVRLRELERCVKMAMGHDFQLTVKMNGISVFPFQAESSTRARKRNPSPRKAPKPRIAAKRKPKRR